MYWLPSVFLTPYRISLTFCPTLLSVTLALLVSLRRLTPRRSPNKFKPGAAPITLLIYIHSITHRAAPSPDTGFLLTVPRAEDAPRITARLLATSIPFAVLLPSDLAPHIAAHNQFEDQPDLRDAYKSAGKIMFLDSEQIWIIGNVPTLQHFHHIYSHVLQRPAPLLEIFANTLHPNLPTTIIDWKNAQDNEPEFFTTLDPDSLAHCNGLTIYKDADFPSRIIVPPSLRTQLIRQHHADLQHVSHTKILTSLSRHYFWPAMKTDVRIVCEDCELCENEKAKRRLAHGMFSSDTTSKPRSRYAMDFQGQGLATSGETEALALIDSFTKTVILIPLHDRKALTLVPRLLDELHFRRGSPDVLHSDDARNSLVNFLTSLSPSPARNARPPTAITRSQMVRLSLGGAFGIAPCATYPTLNTLSGLFMPNAFASPTAQSPTIRLPNSHLLKWILAPHPSPLLAHRVRVRVRV